MINSYEYPPAAVQDEIVRTMIQECINAEEFKIVKFYPNGYGVSIIRNRWSYGGQDGLYELAVLKGSEKHSNLTYDTPITNDVIGYLTYDEATDIANKVEALPGSKEEAEKVDEDVQSVIDSYQSSY